MGYLAIWAILACLPGAIAQAKGRSFIAWWLYGVALLPIALIHSLVAEDLKNPDPVWTAAMRARTHRQCPFCAEEVKREAVVCKHCARDLPPEAAPPRPAQETY
jgi:hypothetical protein